MLTSHILLAALLPLAFAKGGDGRDGDQDGASSSTSSSAGASPTTASSNTIPGDTTGLTGDTQCVDLMCISAVVNGSTVEYVLQSTGIQTLGWMAMGFGQIMANTPMVIMWANSNGPVTLSQRQAPGEIMPTVVASPPRVATVSQTLTVTSGTQPKFGYTIPKNADTQQNIIWAFGTTNPGTSAVDAPLTQHLSSGSLTLDLTKPLASSNATSTSNPASSAGSSSSGGSGVPALTSSQKIIVAHGIVASVGFLLLLPFGALLARYLRTSYPGWFKGHAFVQFFIAGPVVVTGVALGIAAVSQNGGDHLSDSHMKWGIALLIVYFVQCGLGAVIHWVKPKSMRGRRPPQNYVHAILGLAIVGFAFGQVRDGYREEWPAKTGRGALPGAVNTVWVVWVVLVPLLYVAGLAFLPRQLKQEKGNRMRTYDLSDVSLSRTQMLMRDRA